MNFLRSVIALCSGFATYRPYRDVALTASLKYLLKLIMLLALVLAISAVPPALERIDAFARRFDDRRPEFAIKDGKIEGANISFNVTFDFGGMPFTLAYKGVVSGDSIKFSGDAGGMPFEVVVKKAK